MGIILMTIGLGPPLVLLNYFRFSISVVAPLSRIKNINNIENITNDFIQSLTAKITAPFELYTDKE